jgi:D-glycero-D-manno-heptose 1,7-bisphosphate phosphatase
MNKGASSDLPASSKALFLDRDGTLMVDRNYLADPEGVELLDGAAEALRIARRLGYRLFLFTNQSGVARKLFTLEAVHAIHARMEALMGLPGPLFTDICIAPEGADEPPVYRKPCPRFILEMIASHKLDPAQCFMVGDANSDIMAAVNAGIHPIGLPGPRLDVDALPEPARSRLRRFGSLLEFVRSLEPSAG